MSLANINSPSYIGYNCSNNNCMNINFEEIVSCVECNTLDSKYFKLVDVNNCLVQVTINCISCGSLLHAHSFFVDNCHFSDFVGSYSEYIQNPRIMDCITNHSQFVLVQDSHWDSNPPSFYQSTKMRCEHCDQILFDTKSPSYPSLFIKGCITLRISKVGTFRVTGA